MIACIKNNLAAVLIMIFFTVVILCFTGYEVRCNILAWNQIIATQPESRQTTIYIGNNPSAKANAITGSTVHLNYDDFVRHSKNAIETYLVRESDKQSEMHNVIYALSATGHTYSTVLEISQPEIYYHERNRSINTKEGLLVINWQMDKHNKSTLPTIVLGLLLALLACYITVSIQSCINDSRKTK